MTEEFIACSGPRVLPDEQAFAAGRTAVEINPANAPAVEQMMAIYGAAFLTPGFLSSLTGKCWAASGVSLTVSFLDNPTLTCRNRILSHMNAWGEHCNARFTWTQSGGKVRINRGQGGFWSYLGTDILHIPAGQPTMNLQGFTENTAETEYRRVVRHETGHTLSFPHEHSLPGIIALLDFEKCIAVKMRQTGWSRQQVIQQVLTPPPVSSYRMSVSADPNGIMCYSFSGEETKSGQPIPGGNDIDSIDAQFSNVLFPKAIQPPEPPPPPPPPTGGNDFEFSVSVNATATNKTVRIRTPAGYTVTREPAQQLGETII